MNTLPPVIRVALWMCLTAVGFAVMIGSVRELSAHLDVFVISFWRNLAAVLLFLPWIARMGLSGLKTERWGLFWLRAVIMLASSVAMFLGAILLPLSEATALSFTTPLFVTLLAWIVLGERFGWRRAAAVAFGFIGMLIMTRPDAEALNLGALVVLLAAITFAGVVITGKKLSATENPALITLYLSLLPLPLSLLPALYFWEWPTGNDWLWIVTLGVGAVINIYGISRALAVGDASLLQPFDFLRLPTVALVGWFVFRESTDMWTWIGAALIAAAAIYTANREARLRQT